MWLAAPAVYSCRFACKTGWYLVVLDVRSIECSECWNRVLEQSVECRVLRMDWFSGPFNSHGSRVV